MKRLFCLLAALVLGLAVWPAWSSEANSETGSIKWTYNLGRGANAICAVTDFDVSVFDDVLGITEVHRVADEQLIMIYSREDAFYRSSSMIGGIQAGDVLIVSCGYPCQVSIRGEQIFHYAQTKNILPRVVYVGERKYVFIAIPPGLTITARQWFDQFGILAVGSLEQGAIPPKEPVSYNYLLDPYTGASITYQDQWEMYDIPLASGRVYIIESWPAVSASRAPDCPSGVQTAGKDILLGSFSLKADRDVVYTYFGLDLCREGENLSVENLRLLFNGQEMTRGAEIWSNCAYLYWSSDEGTAPVKDGILEIIGDVSGAGGLNVYFNGYWGRGMESTGIVYRGHPSAKLIFE